MFLTHAYDADRLAAETVADSLLEHLIPATAKRRLGQFIASVVRQEIDRLPHALTDSDVFLNQIVTILRREHGLIPPPPKHLQVRVVGGYVPGFIESGFRVYAELSAALQPAGRTLEDFPRILDFGCGCGRVIRAMHTCLPRARLFGIDIDPEAIAWLTANYASMAEFFVAPHNPPTPLGDGHVDFVYGISVFTHLPEDMQFRWLEELRRVTSPGGYLILTIHGEKQRDDLPAEFARRVLEKGFFYAAPGTMPGLADYARDISLPDFYQTAYHTHDYIRREWSRYFEVVGIQTLGLEHHQDIVLLRRSG